MQTPINPVPLIPLGIDGQSRGWRQFADTLEKGARCRDDRMQGQLVVQRYRVDSGIGIPGGQQCLAVGGKAERMRGSAVIQRLNTQPVTGKEKRVLALVPKGESEHTGQMLDTLLAPFRVGFKNDFGVALGEEAVAFGL